MKIKLLIIFGLLAPFINQTVQGQIFAPEGLNIPGGYDEQSQGTFNNPPIVDAVGGIQVTGGKVLPNLNLSTAIYSTKIEVATSGGDIVGGNYNWLFTSGPTGSPYANKWAGVNVTLNTIQNYSFNSGPDNNITFTNGNWYTVNWRDRGYASTEAIFMETNAQPVTISAVSAPSIVGPGQDVDINITLNSAKSADEKVFLIYTNNAFASREAIEVTNFGASTSGSVILSDVTAGATYTYYVITTSINLDLTGQGAEYYDMRTININNNSGPNYNFTPASAWVTSGTTTNWSLGTTWAAGEIPAANQPVEINHDVTLDQNATVSSLTINSGTFTASDGLARELTISRSNAGNANTISNSSGTWANGTGGSTVVFTGAPSSGDAIHATSGMLAFQNVTINKTGGSNNVGVDFQNNSSVSGTLKIGVGGFVSTAAPIGFYASSAILEFNQGADATYDVGVTDNSWSTIEIPQNITVNSGTVNLNANRAATGDLIVESNALLNVSAGSILEINSDLTNNGTITLNSTSALYSSLIPTSVTNNGTITYKRFTNAIGSGTSGGNDLVAAPLSGQSVADFVTANPNLAQNGDNSQVAFAIFDHTIGSYDNYTPNSSEMLSAGTGYRAATTGGGTLAYTGAVATGPITTSISAAASVWNLIGNPYPSYISSADFLSAANTALLDPAATAIYGYNDGTYSGTGDTVGNFTIINNNSNSGLNIAPGQGFFVASNADGGAITFTPAMRTAIGADDFILGRSTAPNYYLLLELHSNAIYRTSFYFNENSTLGLDPGYDAAVFGNNSTNYPIYSHLVEDHTGRPMAMQSLNDTDLSNVTIALGVNANAGEQLSFSIGESSLPHTVNVYLEDTATNTYTLLNTGDYTLTPNSALNGVGRFYLRFGDTALSAADATLENVTLYTNQKAKTIDIAGQLLESTTAFIYDIQGRLVVTQHLDPKLRLNQVDVTSLRQGIYIVALRSKAQNKSLKVILN